MRFLTFTFIALMLLFRSELPSAQERIFVDEDGSYLVKNGLFDGNKFLELNEWQKQIYISGLLDGLLTSPILMAGNSGPERRLADCVNGKGNTQLADVLEAYLKENPFKRDQSVGSLFVWAIDENCQVLADDDE